MRQTVWKFELHRAGAFAVKMPHVFAFLKVDAQQERPVLWALVDADSEAKDRRFYVLMTGEAANSTFEESYFYLGSFMLAGGGFLGHVFIDKRDIKVQAMALA